MCESVVLPIRFFFLLTRRPPRSTRTDTLFPYTTLFRSLAIIGVVHSHTHTDAYPSPTDVAQAPDPDWHYVIVSLRDEAPVLRSYRIVDGTIIEERSEEHTSELQSLMRTSYAVFCLQKKNAQVQRP